MKELRKLPDEIRILDCVVPVQYLHNVPTTEIHAYGVKKLRQNPPGGTVFITLPESLISRWDELKEIEPPFFGEGWKVEVEFKNHLGHPWDNAVEEARLIDSDSYEKWQSHCKERPEILKQRKEFWPASKDVDPLEFPEPVEEVYGTDRKGNPLVAILQPHRALFGRGFETSWYLNRFEGEADRRRAQEMVESAKKHHRMRLAMKEMAVPDPYDPAAEFPKLQRFEDNGWIAIVENYSNRWYPMEFIGLKAEYFEDCFNDKAFLEEVVTAQWEKAKARFEGPRTCRIAIGMVQEHLQSRNPGAAKKFSRMFSSVKEGSLGLGQGTYGGDCNNENFFAAGAIPKKSNWDMKFRLSETRLVEWEFSSDPAADLKMVADELEKGILKESLI